RGRRPGELPEHPGLRRGVRGDRRGLPGRAAVRCHLNLADAAQPGEGDTGNGDRLERRDRVTLGRIVNPRERFDDRGAIPPLRLIETFRMVRSQVNARYPLDVLLTVP